MSFFHLCIVMLNSHLFMSFSHVFGLFSGLISWWQRCPIKAGRLCLFKEVCFVILNVTLVKLCTSGEINSKVYFDAIKLLFLKKKLAVCSFLLQIFASTRQYSLWSTLLTQPEKLFQ